MAWNSKKIKKPCLPPYSFQDNFFNLSFHKKKPTIWQLIRIDGRDGNGAGWGQRMESSSLPRPAPHDEEDFLTPFLPLGPREASPHPIKLYFLLIFPATSTIFLMKPISLIKIYLKLQLNLSHQIKSIFRKKKLNNISKRLTR